MQSLSLNVRAGNSGASFQFRNAGTELARFALILSGVLELFQEKGPRRRESQVRGT
jgi:hypothetical protein